MKMKILTVATTLVTSTAMADVTPFVGVEREMNNATNRAIVGVAAGFGPVGIEAKYNMTAPNNLKFQGEKVDVDLTTSIGDNVDLYMKNELSKSFKHTATVVGVKLSF